MGKVIGFSRRAPSRREPDPAEERERLRESAAALREELSKNRKTSSEDRTRIAEALWKLLDRVERQAGYSVTDVFVAAGVSEREDSTKRKTNFAVDPAWPQDRKTKARVVITPRRQLEIVSAVAKLTTWDADELLMEVFGATSLAGPHKGHEAAPEYATLALTLRQVMQAVSAKHRLQAYFQAVARARPALSVVSTRKESSARPKPEEIELCFSEDEWSNHVDWPVTFRKPIAADEFEAFETVPPYPTIILGTWDIGEGFPPLTAAKASRGQPDPGLQAAAEDAGRSSVELRLCIIPVGPEMLPEAALYIVHQGCGAYLPITGKVCEDWFGMETAESKWTGEDMPPYVAVLGPPLSGNEAGFSAFKAGTLAAALDRSLSGQEDPDILTLFDQRASRLVSLLEAAERDAQRLRAAGYAQLQARLASMRDGQM